jgi:hypothetical protein
VSYHVRLAYVEGVEQAKEVRCMKREAVALGRLAAEAAAT